MTVVIIDDHPLIRRGLNSLFSLSGSLKVLGEATNRREAMELLNAVKPDIAIVDLRLGEESGIELITEAIRVGIKSKFVILTSSTNEEDFKKAKEIGVAGYLLKEALPEELLHALQMIRKGRKYYDPTVLDLLMKAPTPLDEDGHIEQLTPKEMEILIELGKGHSNKEISKVLYITEFTVKKHVSQVFAKLGLADRTQAALYANAKGLVKYVVNS
ncbi:response regulator transcription factor [Psychrobacillus sp. INOP01]|uniref:response regulator n=1 Tax=Psychrobacillus sp. INOP01 TaxID=2829187 RepID=UPI001BA49521|nr:response regulator transcription factor [Psychrobacillus sp. INOP01]QUG40578.1 response regulator transcription factor [Psychrobacillus sp. INOP01]